MIDPEKRAEILRPRMLKDGKFLISKIGGSEQEKDPKKVISNYFRWKQYIGHHTKYEEEWLKASLKQVWSERFLGLAPNFMKMPLEQAKKLEFQNPAYSAAFALKGKRGDPRDYSKVFAVQVSGCTYNCNYCYVPPAINQANRELGKYFSAKEIVESFSAIREDGINVLRITGGEATTIVPEIIIDAYEELEDLDNVYLWIDTNMSTTKYLEKIEGDLKYVLRKRNVGIVGCFKGIDSKDFSMITGSEKKSYEKQWDTCRFLVEMGSDFYVYLPALAYGNDLEKRTRSFMEGLAQISKNLPLRAEILIVKDYTGAISNMEDKKREGRPMPSTDQRLFLDIWYNKLLPKRYPKGMLGKFCCEISL